MHLVGVSPGRNCTYSATLVAMTERRFTTVTAMGDEETFVVIERACEAAALLADRSRRYADVVDESTEATVYVAVSS